MSGPVIMMKHPSEPMLVGELGEFHGSLIISTHRGTRYVEVFREMGYSFDPEPSWAGNPTPLNTERGES